MLDIFVAEQFDDDDVSSDVLAFMGLKVALGFRKSLDEDDVDPFVVQFSNGLAVRVVPTLMPWRERLIEHWEMANMLPEHHNVALHEGLFRLLRADGWVLRLETLMTPPWLPEGIEVPYASFKDDPELSWFANLAQVDS